MKTSHLKKKHILRTGTCLTVLACGLAAAAQQAQPDGASLDWKPISSVSASDFTSANRIKIVYERMKQPAEVSPVDRMRQALILERWSDIFKIINQQPAAARPDIARMLLTAIRDCRPWTQQGGSATSAIKDPGQDDAIMMDDGSRKQLPRAPIATPVDLPGMRNTTLETVISLAGYLPAPAAQKDSILLASILRSWLANNPAGQQAFSKALIKGISGWGGPGADGKLAAIALLADCGQPGLALAHLDPLEDVKKSGNLDLVWLHWQGMWEQATTGGINERYGDCWKLAEWLLANNLNDDRRKTIYEAQILCLPLINENDAGKWLAERLLTPATEEILVRKVLSIEAKKNTCQREADRVNLLRLNDMLLKALLAREGEKPAGRACIIGQLINYWQAELVQAVNKQREREQQENNYRYQDPKPPFRFNDPLAPSQEVVNRLRPAIDVGVINSVLEPADQIRNFQSSLRLALAQDAQQQNNFKESRRILREIAKLDPATATGMVNEFMNSCISSFSANPIQDPRRNRMYYGGQQPTPVGVPLTRAHQERNLLLLKDLLKELNGFLPSQVPADVTIKAFTACYSPAEVYHLQDIKDIFAPLDRMPVEHAFLFAETMRSQLAKNWQDQKVQQAAQTNRTPAEALNEVKQGYADLQAFLDAVALNRSEEWLLTLYLGVVTFDRAEFDYANGGKLEDYARQRNKAFDAMELACERYREVLKAGKITDPGERPWLMWFNSVLQASSLADPDIKINEKNEVESSFVSQVLRVRNSLRKLPEGTYSYHRDRLADALYTQSVGAGEGKILWLERSFNLIKNPEKGSRETTHPDDLKPNPVAARIQSLLAFYQELLKEIHVQVDLDGDSSIAPGADFGFLVSVRHTKTLGRESGGFSRYLTNSPQQMMYYGGMGNQQPRQYRDDIDKSIRLALENSFVIRSITFLDPSARPLPLGDGEQTTPLAYVQLTPKDKVQDGIPSIKLNFDFFDKSGQVILPVPSSPVKVKIEPQAAPRPVKDLEISQIFDQRKLGDNKAQLEIVATGKGVIPGLADLFGGKAAAIDEGKEFQGFLIRRITDSGSQVNTVEGKDDRVEVNAERSWIIELEASGLDSLPTGFSFTKVGRVLRNVFKPDMGSLPEHFDFLPVAMPEAKPLYKQYRDADLAETGPSVAIEIPGRSRLVSFIVKASLAILVLLGGFWFWRRALAKIQVPVETSRFELPAALNAFSALHLLDQIRSSGRIGTAALAELDADIQALQKQHFAAGSVTANANEAELRDLCLRWISRT